jgi:hypothetical protein
VISFDIAARAGYWDNTAGRYVLAPGRQAQIYVLAHHPRCDAGTDHCDPGQWWFYVVATSALAADRPNAKRISLAGVEKLATRVSWGELRTAVERARA